MGTSTSFGWLLGTHFSPLGNLLETVHAWCMHEGHHRVFFFCARMLFIPSLASCVCFGSLEP